MLECAH